MSKTFPFATQKCGSDSTSKRQLTTPVPWKAGVPKPFSDQKVMTPGRCLSPHAMSRNFPFATREMPALLDIKKSTYHTVPWKDCVPKQIFRSKIDYSWSVTATSSCNHVKDFSFRETERRARLDIKTSTSHTSKISTIAINVETQDYTMPLPGESCQPHITAITHRYRIVQSHHLPTKHT